MCLETLRTKASIEILKVLIHIVEKFGKPVRLRTDNEPVFTSRLFRLGLFLLGIRHQRIAPFAPWQNGRIERLLGTFKEKIRKWPTTAAELSGELRIFRFWYNHVRPHHHLDGRTPAQAWSGDLGGRYRTRVRSFSEWDGLLAGFWLNDS